MDDALLVGAVILGAGRSQRMGVPKLSLPWGRTTVIEHIVSILKTAEVSPIVLVTGGARAELQDLLRDAGISFAHNPEYTNTQMLETLQIGLREIPAEVSACLIVLGDQPQIEYQIVEKLLREYRRGKGDIVVPSYNMKRGHPWLVGKDLWEEIEALRSPQTLKDFLAEFSSSIHYVEVNSNSVLLDLDTPEDYQNQRP